MTKKLFLTGPTVMPIKYLEFAPSQSGTSRIERARDYLFYLVKGD